MQNKFTKENTKLTSYLKDLIDSEIKKRNFSSNHEVFNAKHLTQCPRRIYYRANAIPEETKTCKTLYELKAQKDKWINLFDKSKSVDVLRRNIIASDTNYNIIGEIDGVLKCKEIIFLILLEELPSIAYNRAKTKGGSRKLIVEMMANLWMTDIENGIILYENSKTKEYFLSHVVIHPSILNSIKHKCLDILEKKLMGETPLRPFEDDNNQECRICEYNKFCWK